MDAIPDARSFRLLAAIAWVCRAAALGVLLSYSARVLLLFARRCARACLHAARAAADFARRCARACLHAARAAADFARRLARSCLHAARAAADFARRCAREKNERSRPHWSVDVSVLCAVVAFYCALFWPMEKAMGMSTDDADLGAMAGTALRWIGLFLYRRPLGYLQFPTIFAWGHGPWAAYMIAPFLLLFGRTVGAMSLNIAFFGSLSILAVYAAGRALFDDRPAALCAAGLLAASPFFLSLSTWAGQAGLRELPFALGSLAFAAMAIRGAGLWAWPCAGLCLGISLGCRWTMLGWAGGLLTCAAAAQPRLSGGFPRIPNAVKICALGLFLGPLIPLAAGWRTNPGPASYAQAHLLTRSEDSQSMLDFVSNFGIRWEQATSAPGLWVGPNGILSKPVPWLSGVIGFLCVLGLSLSFHRRAGTAASWPWIMGLTYLSLSTFSPSQLRIVHLLPLLPLMALAAAAPAAMAPGGFRSAALAAVAAVAVVNAAAMWRLAPDIRRDIIAREARDGSPAPVDMQAASMLNRWLPAHSDAPLMILSSPLGSFTHYFTSGRDDDDLLVDLPSPERARESWDRLLRQRETPRFAFVRGSTPFPVLQLRIAARRQGKSLREVAVLDAPGSPTLIIAEIGDSGRARKLAAVR
ncbi:MAG: glycosyltransferase family 39 protein [Elusimicrobiota bacterium]